ncbi:hypothetical protein OAP94_00430 [bacterium]|jgi:hypothetical protein|nr:hypothetical protein [bacterium]MDC1007128.1 hypothetical protein [bacterium]
MAIESTAIASTDTNLLLVPGGKSYAVLTIMVCNTEAPNLGHEEHGISNFDLHLVKSGAAKSNTNMVVRSLELPAGETFTFDSEKIVLEAGDKIVALGESPTNLVATVSFLEV